VNTKKVERAYDAMIDRLGSELDILLDRPLAEIERSADDRIAGGIAKMRSGEVHIEPGYDGVYGRIEIPFDETEQMELF
jgi:PHP family Zn ribbon phosphoesterase